MTKKDCEECFECGVLACKLAFGSKENVQHDCTDCDCHNLCRYCSKLLTCRIKQNNTGMWTVIK